MNSLSVPQNLFFEDDDYDKSSYEKKVPTRTKPAPKGR
jgi:hypothetical protein